MIEPTQVIKFSQRLAFTRGRAAPFPLSNRVSPPLLLSTRDPLFSIVSHRLQTLPYSYLSPGYHPLLFFPPSTSLGALSFFLFPLPFSSFFHLRPLRRLAINHGAVHERCCSRSNDSLSLSLSSLDFYCFP